MPSFILFATPFSDLDKGWSMQNPTSNQFNQSKHYTMKKACRKTTNHPFSIWHNGKKLSFSGNFTYALNGWFLTEITLANNFEQFSFFLQNCKAVWKKIWTLILLNMNLDVRSRKVCTKLFQPKVGFHVRRFARFVTIYAI